MSDIDYVSNYFKEKTDLKVIDKKNYITKKEVIQKLKETKKDKEDLFTDIKVEFLIVPVGDVSFDYHIEYEAKIGVVDKGLFHIAQEKWKDAVFDVTGKRPAFCNAISMGIILGDTMVNDKKRGSIPPLPKEENFISEWKDIEGDISGEYETGRHVLCNTSQKALDKLALKAFESDDFNEVLRQEELSKYISKPTSYEKIASSTDNAFFKEIKKSIYKKHNTEYFQDTSFTKYEKDFHGNIKFIPFYKITCKYKEKEKSYYCNAKTGEISSTSFSIFLDPIIFFIIGAIGIALILIL